MRIILTIIIVLHGLIHLLGFLKAYQIYEAKELTLPISKLWGILWLLAFVLLIIAAIGYGLHADYWWLIALIAAILSQILIIYFWKDAKFGTIVNVVILIMCIVGYSNWRFMAGYHRDVQIGITRTNAIADEILQESDLQPLPELVQKYLRYVGVVGKPKVQNMRVSFTAQMRSKTQDWFDLTVEQHNFFDQYERLFILDATVNGLPTQGYHRYKDGNAGMLIKLLSMVPVVDVKGEKMFEAETVTLFNDMCFLAPARLIDRHIQWEALDSLSVKAAFTNQSKTISAILYFNEVGQLINFISDDRYDVNEMKKFRFSTPLSEYQTINGYQLATYGEAIWHYPQGEFVYGKYTLENIKYNVTRE